MSERTKKKYSLEFKQDAAKLVTEQDYKISEAARRTGTLFPMRPSLKWRQF